MNALNGTVVDQFRAQLNPTGSRDSDVVWSVGARFSAFIALNRLNLTTPLAVLRCRLVTVLVALRAGPTQQPRPLTFAETMILRKRRT